MSLEIKISEPNLELNETHTQTIVQIARDTGFTDLIFNHTENTNKLVFSVDKEFPPNVKYYLRARFIFDPGGLQQWSDTIEITGYDSKDYKVTIDPPYLSSPPTVSINVDRESAPLSGIRFTLSAPRITTTDWILTDIDGNIVMDSIDDNQNLSSILVTRPLLPSTVYTMHASIEGTVGAKSLPATISFSTGYYTHRGLEFDSARGDFGKDNPTTLYLKLPTGATNVTSNLILNGEIKSPIPVAGDKLDLSGLNIPEGFYTISAKATLADGSIAGNIYYSGNKIISKVLPGNLDYPLAANNTLEWIDFDGIPKVNTQIVHFNRPAGAVTVNYVLYKDNVEIKSENIPGDSIDVAAMQLDNGNYKIELRGYDADGNLRINF